MTPPQDLPALDGIGNLGAAIVMEAWFTFGLSQVDASRYSAEEIDDARSRFIRITVGRFVFTDHAPAGSVEEFIINEAARRV